MAIDALIAWTRLTDEGLELDLVARDSSAGPAGQPRLVILNPTWRPAVGMTVCGGDASVEIAGRRYRRAGYTRLEEALGP